MPSRGLRQPKLPGFMDVDTRRWLENALVSQTLRNWSRAAAHDLVGTPPSRRRVWRIMTAGTTIHDGFSTVPAPWAVRGGVGPEGPGKLSLFAGWI